MARIPDKERWDPDACGGGRHRQAEIEPADDDDTLTNWITGHEQQAGFAEEGDGRLPLDKVFR
jgi:hypothetical protein